MFKINEISLIDSCIALEQQIKKCESFIENKQKSFGNGMTTKEVLLTSAKELLIDSEKLLELKGKCTWVEEKRQRALSILNYNA